MGNFYDKNKSLLKTEITSSQINDALINQSNNITTEYYDNTMNDCLNYEIKKINKENSCETRKLSIHVN